MGPVTVVCFRASLVAQLVKQLPAVGRPGAENWVGKVPWRRERLPTPVFWPGEFHGSNLGFLQVECLARSHQGSTPFPTTLYTITVAKITNSISLQRQTSRDIVGSVLDHRP